MKLPKKTQKEKQVRITGKHILLIDFIDGFGEKNGRLYFKMAQRT